MEDRKDKQIVQQVFESSLSGIQDDPWMAQRVLNKAHEAPGTGGFIVKKKMSLAMVLLIICLFLSASVALAAIISNTAQRFGDLYGEDWTDAALRGDIDTSNPSIQIGDVVYTMDDVIVTGIELEMEGLTEDDTMCTRILATGTMRAAEGTNVVLMPEDYLVSDPWNFDPYYNGHANVPAGVVSVIEKAAETDAEILCTRATANGLVDSEGNLYDCDLVYTGIMQEDGSIVFHMEIGLFEPIPRQDNYTLSVYIANHQVTPENEHLMETRVSEDWVFTIHPQKTEGQPVDMQQPAVDESAAQQAETEQPISQPEPVAGVADVQFANWEDTVRPLVNEAVIVTVKDPITGISWQMQVVVAENGNYADAKPISKTEAETMVSAVGSVLSPKPVYVIFPNGQSCFGTFGSWGYEHEEDVVYDEDGTVTLIKEDGWVVELQQVAYLHFPRTDHDLDPKGYGAAHQKVLKQAWEELQR